MASKKKASGTDQIVRCFEVGNPRLHEKGHTIYKVTLKVGRLLVWKFRDKLDTTELRSICTAVFLVQGSTRVSTNPEMQQN